MARCAEDLFENARAARDVLDGWLRAQPDVQVLGVHVVTDRWGQLVLQADLYGVSADLHARTPATVCDVVVHLVDVAAPHPLAWMQQP